MLEEKIQKFIEWFLLSAQDSVSLEQLAAGGYIAVLMRPLQVGLYVTGAEGMERIYLTKDVPEPHTATLGDVLQEGIRSCPGAVRDSVMAGYETEAINLVLQFILGQPVARLLMIKRGEGLASATKITELNISEPVLQSQMN